MVFGFYTGVILLTLWGGAKAIDYVVDYRFYHSFLSPWSTALDRYRRHGGAWPKFAGHVEYMNSCVQLLRDEVDFQPTGSGRGNYMYRLKKPGDPAHNVFLLALPERIVIYDLPRVTTERIDRFIDGRTNLSTGDFQARPGRGGKGLTAVWQY